MLIYVRSIQHMDVILCCVMNVILLLLKNILVNSAVKILN